MANNSDKNAEITAMTIFNSLTIVILYTEMALCFGLNTISLCFIVGTRLFTPINILILNLVIVDIVYASCIPFYVSQFAEQDVSFSLAGCRMSYFLDVTCMLVSVD
jgi:hypothetical protein